MLCVWRTSDEALAEPSMVSLSFRSCGDAWGPRMYGTSTKTHAATKVPRSPRADTLIYTPDNCSAVDGDVSFTVCWTESFFAAFRAFTIFGIACARVWGWFTYFCPAQERSEHTLKCRYPMLHIIDALGLLHCTSSSIPKDISLSYRYEICAVTASTSSFPKFSLNVVNVSPFC